MFIRWLTYESTAQLSWGRSEDKRLTAILVESVRVDDKPRKSALRVSTRPVRKSGLDPPRPPPLQRIVLPLVVLFPSRYIVVVKHTNAHLH